MSDMLDYISTWSVLKWVALVLVAGFLGQFGRMTAEAIVKKIRLKRDRRKASADSPEPLKINLSPDDPETELPVDAGASARAKSEKKALKATEKFRKKEAKTKSS